MKRLQRILPVTTGVLSNVNVRHPAPPATWVYLFHEKVSFTILCRVRFFCKAHLTFYSVCYTISAKLALHLWKEEHLDTRIKELRKEKKISQEQLALAVGTTRQTITSIEVGKYTASLALAYKIARNFWLSIEDVFDFSEIDAELDSLSSKRYAGLN